MPLVGALYNGNVMVGNRITCWQHLLGPVLPRGFPGGDARIHALECFSGFNPTDAVFCPLPTGGGVIHTEGTVHGVEPNVSDRGRLACVLLFDRVPTPAKMTRTFPWRAVHRTARAQRALAWRRRGGLLVHLWRQRTRMRVTKIRTLLFDMRRAARAVRKMVLRNNPSIAAPPRRRPFGAPFV
ncbi:MAG: hypothetical protein ABSC06_30560 [Rhodopila sp.]